MALGQVGQNSAEEFFETILYGTAYEEARSQINGMTSDIESSIMQDAVQSAMTVLSAGLIFQLVRKQEAVIEGIFNTAKGLTIILLGSGFGQKIGNKLSGLRGFKLIKKLEMFKSAYSDRVATAQLVVDGARNVAVGQSTVQGETNRLSTATQMREHIVSKEKLNHSVGNSMASRYNETLLFKLLTKSFTPNDEMIIKKILGRDTASELDINEMNKVADFMFVTDDSGNVTGLSEQMFQLLNGLGYTHK